MKPTTKLTTVKNPSCSRHFVPFGLAVLALFLSIQLTSAQTLSTALDGANLVWTTGGSASWAGQATLTHDGVDAARSGTISDGQESWLQTTVTGPGTVAFWWKVSSEGDYDFFEFYVGATRRQQISGEQDWRQVVFSVPAGSQTLRWRYVKDVGTNLGQDGGWVDEVRFVPASGSPVILIQPASQTVLTSVTARLQVSAGGRTPLSYAWYRDETNLIVGATTATLTVANVQLTNAGPYHVVVTNLDGAVSSSSALLTVTTLGGVNNVLLLVDHLRVSPYESALTSQGWAYRRFNLANELAFNLAVESADPGKSLVLVDTAEAGHSLGYVERFVRAGGRAILQYYLLGVTPGSTVPAAFQVSVPQSLSGALPLYNWGSSAFFTGVTSPINFQDVYLTDGQKLQPTGGARAVAGFVSAATMSEAAVVIGNSNRTIVNGFILATATSSADASRFAQNQIEYLIGPPVPMPPVISVQPEDVTAVNGAAPAFVVLASGPPPLQYQWYFNQTNALTNGTNATLVIPNVHLADAGEYQLVVTNLSGSVTSRVALLTLTTSGPVETVLLYNDYSSTIYETALNNLGRAYQRFNGDSGSQFTAAVRSAHPGTSLVIVDAVDRVLDVSAVDRFARVGGRVVLEYFNLQAGSLATAFNLSTVQPFTVPPPVRNWGGSPFFAGVASPIALSDSLMIDGQRLQPNAGGQAVAGFTVSSTANQAAVVIGNSGRTIVNGFAVEEIGDNAAAVRFVENEILELLLAVPPRITGIALTNGVVEIIFTTVARGTYQMQSAPELTGPWTPVGVAVPGDGQAKSVTDVRASDPRRFYRVVKN